MQTQTHDPVDLTPDPRVSVDESLTGVLRELAAAGFAGSFRPAREPVEGQAAVICAACGRSSPARDLGVERERRLEGASDPDDMVLAVAASCPACGARGVLVLGYGPEASPEDADVVVALHVPGPGAHGGGADERPGGGDGDGNGDGDGGAVADPGGDSDPDANEGFEAPEPSTDSFGSSDRPVLGRIGPALDRIEALDPIADSVRRIILDRVPERVRSVLQGSWLGHPVHPALTDLPIGFWTSAWVLDLVGGERTEGAADALVAAGVVTAVPTAWAGWADWTDLPYAKRRAGLVHAAANGAAIGLYAASFVQRRRGSRTVGVGLAHAGAAVATVGGFLGGHLVFGDD